MESDEQVRHITAAIAKGDPDAFAAFYEAWFDRAYALVRFIAKRDESFCLDIVQDAMLKTVRRMRAFESEKALANWVARLLYTTTIDSLRREARRLRRERAYHERRRADVRSRSRSEQDEERIHWLEERLAELNATERSLLFQRFSLGKTLAQVGAALGLSGDAAHGRIHRLLARLRGSARKVL